MTPFFLLSAYIAHPALQRYVANMAARSECLGLQMATSPDGTDASVPEGWISSALALGMDWGELHQGGQVGALGVVLGSAVG
jgi:hypothetical protein